MEYLFEMWSLDEKGFYIRWNLKHGNESHFSKKIFPIRIIFNLIRSYMKSLKKEYYDNLL